MNNNYIDLYFYDGCLYKKSMLFKDEKLYKDVIKSSIKNLKKPKENLILKCKSNENVVLFGASNRAIEAYKYLKYKYKIKYFCDNDANKWGKKIKNIEIISPDQLKSLKDFKVILTSMYEKEIAEQLRTLGILNFISVNEIKPFTKAPIKKVFNLLENNGLKLNEMKVLEPFGGIGQQQIKDYSENVKSLDIWEIIPQYKAILEKNISCANVKTTDSYIEITQTNKKFNVIFLDAPLNKHGDHYENFDMFPNVLNLLGEKSALVLNVIPDIMPIERDFFKFDYEHIEKRNKFFNVEDSRKVSFNRIIKGYEKIIEDANFQINKCFLVQRMPKGLYYLIFILRHGKI